MIQHNFLFTFLKWYENIEGNSSDARKTAEVTQNSHKVTRWYKQQPIAKYSLCSYMTTHCAPVHQQTFYLAKSRH